MGALKYSVTKWSKRVWVSRSSRKISLELFEGRLNFRYTERDSQFGVSEAEKILKEKSMYQLESWDTQVEKVRTNFDSVSEIHTVV